MVGECSFIDSLNMYAPSVEAINLGKETDNAQVFSVSP